MVDKMTVPKIKEITEKIREWAAATHPDGNYWFDEKWEPIPHTDECNCVERQKEIDEAYE